MKVTVELVDSGGTHEPQRLVVKLKGNPTGARLMNAIDKAVNKEAGQFDWWSRWNLIDIDVLG